MAGVVGERSLGELEAFRDALPSLAQRSPCRTVIGVAGIVAKRVVAGEILLLPQIVLLSGAQPLHPRPDVRARQLESSFRKTADDLVGERTDQRRGWLRILQRLGEDQTGQGRCARLPSPPEQRRILLDQPPTDAAADADARGIAREPQVLGRAGGAGVTRYPTHVTFCHAASEP